MFKKSLFFILSLFFFCGAVFAQDNSDSEDEGVENLLEEDSENENSVVNSALQDNFVIIEPVREHELNPHLTSYSIDCQILTGLYEGLFTYNPVSLEPEYALCKNYKISRDKKRMTFTLRDDAYFSNGKQIKASDVRDSWMQLLETPNAPYSSLFDIVRGAKDYRNGKGSRENVGIVATSDFVLSVYLTSPANYLPRVLCHTAFSVINSNPTVYSGAFTLDDMEDGILILKKNPFYWDYKNTYLEQITIIQSDDADENAFYFNCGLANWVTGEINTQKLLDKSAIQLGAQFGTSYFFFKDSSKKPSENSFDDTENFSPWDKVEFRAAILEAFPWDDFRKNVYVPATTFVYPLTGYPTVEGYDYTDPIEALIKMDAAREKYGIEKDQIIPLTFEISENSISDDKLESFKNALIPLGVELTVIKKSGFRYFSEVASSSSDLFVYNWIGDFADPLAFLMLFQSDSTLNDSGWKNSEFDELIKKAAESTQDSDRYALLAQAETILLDSAEVIPVYRPITFNVIDLKEVGGWSLNGFDLHSFKYIYKKPEISTVDNIVMR